MCLILFAWHRHPEYSLLLAANRDEFHARPTAAAAPWPDAPGVVAGRDLREGGTWLGVGPAARWAAVTNFRDPTPYRPGAPSRGSLVADYLRGSESPESYVRHLAARADSFNGFNLLVGDRQEAYWLSNRAGAPGGSEPARRLAPGLHGLSNHLLDTPWPKVERGKRDLAGILERNPEPDDLLDLLLDRTLAAEHALPRTGIDPARERALSAIFITGPDYGTRSSTALLVHRSGRVVLVERTFTPGTPGFTEVRHDLEPAG